MSIVMVIGAVLVLLALIIVGLPVVLGIASDVHERRLKHQERKMELMADRAAERAAQYAAQVERLEQRMRTLEQIVTDSGYRLTQDIDRLRDGRENLQ